MTWLRDRVGRMMPQVDLPDALFEVHGWNGFLHPFVHINDGATRMRELTTSLVALLVAEACNIGWSPVINPNQEALTRARLVHVDQYYLRADKIKNTAQELKGKAEEAIGTLTGDDAKVAEGKVAEGKVAEGKADQAAAKTKNLGEDVKDVFTK